MQINRVREKPGRHVGTSYPVFRIMLQIAINRLAKKFIGIVSSEKLRGGASVSLTFFLIAITVNIISFVKGRLQTPSVHQSRSKVS